MADPSPTQTIAFGPEADGFANVLHALSQRSAAVTITLRSGERFGTVPVTRHAMPAAAPERCPRPHIDHQRLGLLVDVFDHRRPIDTERTTPSVGTEHAIHLALVPGSYLRRQDEQELALLTSDLFRGPTELSGEPYMSPMEFEPSWDRQEAT